MSRTNSTDSQVAELMRQVLSPGAAATAKVAAAPSATLDPELANLTPAELLKMASDLEHTGAELATVEQIAAMPKVAGAANDPATVTAQYTALRKEATRRAMERLGMSKAASVAPGGLGIIKLAFGDDWVIKLAQIAAHRACKARGGA